MSKTKVVKAEHRKYLHIEFGKDGLYVYADSKNWKGFQKKTLKQLDENCFVDGNPCKLTIPISSLFELVTE